MVAVSFLIFAILLGVILRTGNVAKRIQQYTKGALTYAKVGIKDFKTALKHAAHWIAFIIACLAILFWGAFAVHGIWPTFGGWLMMLVVLLTLSISLAIMWLARAIEGPLSLLDQELNKFSSWLHPFELVIETPDQWKKGWGLIPGVICFLPLALFSSFYLLISLPVKGLEILSRTVARLARFALDQAHRLTRFMAYISLVLLVLAAVIAIELETDIVLIDTVTVGLVFLLAAVPMVFSGLGNRTAGSQQQRNSRPIGTLPMAIFAVSVFIIVLVAHLDASMATGVGQWIADAHDTAAKTLHLHNRQAEDTADIYVVSKVNISSEHAPEGKLWKTVAASTDGHNPLIPAGTVGVLKDPHARGKTTNTHRVMESVCWATDNNPELISDCSVYNYVPKEDLLFFGTFAQATAAAKPMADQRLEKLRLKWPPRENLDVVLNPKVYWQRTGVQVQAGDIVDLTASGKVTISNSPADNYHECDPDGFPYNADVVPASQMVGEKYQFPMVHAPVCGLVMRIGDERTGYTPYFVGKQKRIKVQEGGEIQLVVNKYRGWMFENVGSFQIHIDVH